MQFLGFSFPWMEILVLFQRKRFCFRLNFKSAAAAAVLTAAWFFSQKRKHFFGSAFGVLGFDDDACLVELLSLPLFLSSFFFF